MHTLIKSIFILLLIPNIGICASQEGKATGQFPIKSSPVGKDLTTIGDSQNINPVTHLPRSRDVELEDFPVSIPTQTALDLKANKASTVMSWSEWANGASFTTSSPPVAYNGAIYKCIAPYNKNAGEYPDTQTEYFAEVTGSGAGGITHATSDGSYYASRNGVWMNLSGIFAAPLGSDDNYVTDAEKVKIGNLSGTNTGDQNLSGYALTSSVLSKTNTTAFTPTADYHPATMKFVLDSITAGGGYTDEQAQDAVCLMLSGNTETGITVTCDDVTGKINFVSPTTLASFTDDATHRLVTDTEKTTWNAKQNTLVAGTDYLAPTGSAAGLTGFPTLNQNTTGSAAKLTTARTIGGVSFDGSANISLPGVNAAGTQNTTGNAATATTLQTARTIGGTSFNGSANIDISYANLIGLPPLGTAAALNVGTGANNIVQLNASGQLPFTIDLMDLTSGGTAISPPGTNGYALTANTSGVITWAAMSGGIATDPLEVGTIELGAASDTTIARSGAGAVTVEGVQVVLSGGAIGAATATTPSANDNDTSVATTAYVQTEIAATASDSLTLTNKTIDTAGTGNAITVPLNGVLDGAITDPADVDDMIYVKAPNAMTITDIHCYAEGGGSITLTLQECNDATCSSPVTIENAITCNGGNDEDDGTLSDGAIAAGAWIKVLYSAPTGTVNSLAWSVYGTQTW